MKNVNTQHRISIGLQIAAILILILSQIVYAYRGSLLPPDDMYQDGGESPMRLAAYFAIAIPTVFSLIRAFRGQGLFLSIVSLIPSAFFARIFVSLFFETLIRDGWAYRIHREKIGLGSMQDSLVYGVLFTLLLAASILNFIGWRKNKRNEQKALSNNGVKI